MSVIFNAEMRDKIFPVEFFRNGTISFPEYTAAQYEYDVAMIEFGEEETPEMSFIEQWQTEVYDGKSDLLNTSLHIDPLLLVRVAADCIDHALEFYESSHDYMEEKIKLILQDCRSYAITERAEYLHKHIPDVGKITKSMEKSYTTESWRYYIGYSVYSLTGAVLFFAGVPRGEDLSLGSGGVRLYDVMRTAAKAAAFGAIREVHETPAWSRRHKIEMAWIIRRFVDTMEAVKAGKPWPSLEATE